jgi:hypothetical protein
MYGPELSYCSTNVVVQILTRRVSMYTPPSSTHTAELFTVLVMCSLELEPMLVHLLTSLYRSVSAQAAS